MIKTMIRFTFRWREVQFLRFKYFGTLNEEDPAGNENEMKYDAFFCYRSKFP